MQLLLDALARRARINTLLEQKLVSSSVRFFWTAYVDAVHISRTVSDSQIVNASGTPDAEDLFPFGFIPPYNYPIGTEFHYNAYQHWAIPGVGDGVFLAGTRLDDGMWPFPQNQLRQDYAELPGWRRSTDHTNRIGRGIAEDPDVQSHLYASLWDAWMIYLGG